MFENLTTRLTQTFRGITGKARLSEDNIAETLREVRTALLEADVALSVVRGFVEQVRVRAIGTEVSSSLNPGQAFVKIVHEQLVESMGSQNDQLNLNVRPPAVILMAGLQGAGKTTTVAKLAKRLREQDNKRVMVVSADVYRPAAIEQLRVLAESVGVEFVASTASEQPVDIALRAVAEAKAKLIDVLIVDTAGRLAVDADMMAEIQAIHAAIVPIETLFVVDAMTGQDAALTAKAFNEALPLTGVVLAKADGDARGGAALSVRMVTGKPIKFIGVGEKTDGLEPFHPDRIASRILGMGDVLSLIEDAQRNLDRAKAEKLALKLAKGKRFDLNDLRDQLQQMRNMGGAAAMLEKLPGMSHLKVPETAGIDEQNLKRMEAMICSMTPKERRNPDLLNGSRKRRVAAGSGTDVTDINRLLKQHKNMEKVMKKLSGKGGMAQMMRGLGQSARPGFRAPGR